MVLELNHAVAVFRREDSDPSDIFGLVKEEFYYHQWQDMLEKKTAMAYDESNEEFLEAALENVYYKTQYSNYLSMCLRKLRGENWLYKNQVSYKNFKTWETHDGWSSIFPNLRKNSRNFKVQHGWVKEIVDYMKEEYPNLPIKVEDRRGGKLYYNDPLDFNLGKLTAYDYQEEVIQDLSDKYNGIVDGEYDLRAHRLNALDSRVMLKMAVNSGKTFIAGLHTKNLPKNSHIFLFYSVVLFNQAVGDYIEMGFNVSCICSDEKALKTYLDFKGIPHNYTNGTFGDICLIMARTVVVRIDKGDIDPSELARYDVVYADECQLLASKTIKEIFNYLRPLLVLAYSGTPLEMDDYSKRIEIIGLYGKPFWSRTTAENVAAGVSLQPVVTFVPNAPTGLPRNVKKLKKTELRDIIYKGRTRYRALVKRLRELPNSQTIIYFGNEKLEYGKGLFDKLQEDGFSVCYGDGTNRKKLLESIDKFNNFKVRIGVFNRVIRQGVNMPNIQHFVNWEANANEISVTQAAIGRSIRLFQDMQEVAITDFYDKVPKYEQSSLYRIKVYSSDTIGAIVNLDRIKPEYA